MPIMNPEDLVERRFLMNEQEDEQKFRARIIEAINQHNEKVKNNPELLSANVPSTMMNLRRFFLITTSYMVYTLIKNRT